MTEHQSPDRDHGTAETETVPCNLCGADRPEILFEKKGYHIVRCTGCGLVYESDSRRQGCR